MWLDSYKEEYSSLVEEHTFDVLSKEEYLQIVHTTGKKAVPSMCVQMFKKDSAGNLI